MNVDRKTTRWIIAILLVAGLAWVEAALHGNHYYRLTYAACGGFTDSQICSDWRATAVFRSLCIILLAIAAWIYNDRRTIEPKQ